MTAEPGTVLWQVERDHPAYGYEHGELCINMAAELLLIAGDSDESGSTTLTRDDARGLRDALSAHLGAASTYVHRRHDEAARAAYIEEGSNLESLAAARVGIEHVEHHSRPLRFTGSSYVGDLIVHRFTCADPTCRVRLDWSVTS